MLFLSHLKANPSPHSAPDVGLDPVEPALAKNEPGQDAIATKSEGRKRGRPRKVEEEATAEKTEARQEAGRRQKSLFDF